eukprot:gene24592-10209_t
MQRPSPAANDELFWLCRFPLLNHLDVATKKTWRLVCQQTCKDVEESTRCLIWDQKKPSKGSNGIELVLSQHTILHKCARLHTLKIIHPPFTLSVASLPVSLRTLDVKLDSRTSQVGMPEVPDLEALSSLTALEELRLPCLQATKDLSFLRTCTRLITLDISSCVALVDISALAACRALKTLLLTFCREIKDISALAWCTNLVKLNLSFCFYVSNISALASCTNLQVLHTHWCPNIEDISPLQVLHTHWCPNIEDISPLQNIPPLWVSGYTSPPVVVSGNISIAAPPLLMVSC